MQLELMLNENENFKNNFCQKMKNSCCSKTRNESKHIKFQYFNISRMNDQLSKTLNYLRSSHSNAIIRDPDQIILATPVPTPAIQKRGKGHGA